MSVKIVNIQHHHLKTLHKWEMDEELQVKTGVDVPRTFEQFRHSYGAYFSGEKPNLLLKAIETEGRVIGKLELFRTQKRDFLGIVVAEERGSGIGTKALQLFLDEINRDFGVKDIFAEVYEDNFESLRFFQKNGFEWNGEQNEELFRGMPRTLLTLQKEIKRTPAFPH
ncbi:GNAT family N-acetyltransferase [Halobacillus litoralis]|uniref:N-acetyltransferase domain-containing protein n=1 Tax=Halobacillus litoralis TaxID=45668 RepID=A0A410MB76_9BACI|nr:GNAT family N-acetyltransferase [Halobacillus litoralis]QAS52022.1 hypothetical protein HLI_07195 [Halobacillus litoralis]